jgi:hypothetical protein
VQFIQDVAHVGAHRGLFDGQLCGDLLVALALGHELEYLYFPI